MERGDAPSLRLGSEQNYAQPRGDRESRRGLRTSRGFRRRLHSVKRTDCPNRFFFVQKKKENEDNERIFCLKFLPS